MVGLFRDRRVVGVSRVVLWSHQTQRSSWMVIGTLAGGVAGLLFLIFKMIMAALLGNSIMLPLQYIGAILLGEQMLAPESSLVAVVLAGLSVHMVLSVLYGVAFARVVAMIPLVSRHWRFQALAGTLLGVFLWIVNLYVFAPLFFPWFSESVLVVELMARTLFFGLPLVLIVSYYTADAARATDPTSS